MARGRARWKQVLDAKVYLTKAMPRLERSAPALTSALGYHGIEQAPSQWSWLAETRVPTRMTEAPYAAAYGALRVANVDAPTGKVGHPGHAAGGGPSDLGPLQPLETRRLAALIPQAIVPGHTRLPVDASTGRLLSFYGGTPVKWGVVYPGPSRLRRVPIKGIAWAIPRLRNYFHLLVEHILPVVDALIRDRDRLRTDHVTVIAGRDLPLLHLIIGVLKRIGITMSFEEARPFATYEPEQYLFCKPVSASVEHFYAYPEAVAVLKQALPARSAASFPARLYIPRTGTRIRRLVGEPELMERLTALGCTAFTAHWNNPEEQIARFMAAREIVSVHGAALTNLVWAADGARVIEIFPVNARKTTYLHMASLHHHSYDCVIGGRENERQDFAVDPTAVLRALTA